MVLGVADVTVLPVTPWVVVLAAVAGFAQLFSP